MWTKTSTKSSTKPCSTNWSIRWYQHTFCILYRIYVTNLSEWALMGILSSFSITVSVSQPHSVHLYMNYPLCTPLKLCFTLAGKNNDTMLIWHSTRLAAEMANSIQHWDIRRDLLFYFRMSVPLLGGESHSVAQINEVLRRSVTLTT